MERSRIADRLVALADARVTDDVWLSTIHIAHDAGDDLHAIVDALDALADAGARLPDDLVVDLTTLGATLDEHDRSLLRLPTAAR